MSAPRPSGPLEKLVIVLENTARPGGPCRPRLPNRWAAVPSQGPAEKGPPGGQRAKGDRPPQVSLSKDAPCASDQGRRRAPPWEGGGSVVAASGRGPARSSGPCASRVSGSLVSDAGFVQAAGGDMRPLPRGEGVPLQQAASTAGGPMGSRGPHVSLWGSSYRCPWNFITKRHVG